MGRRVYRESTIGPRNGDTEPYLMLLGIVGREKCIPGESPKSTVCKMCGIADFEMYQVDIGNITVLLCLCSRYAVHILT